MLSCLSIRLSQASMCNTSFCQFQQICWNWLFSGFSVYSWAPNTTDNNMCLAHLDEPWLVMPTKGVHLGVLQHQWLIFTIDVLRTEKHCWRTLWYHYGTEGGPSGPEGLLAIYETWWIINSIPQWSAVSSIRIAQGWEAFSTFHRIFSSICTIQCSASAVAVQPCSRIIADMPHSVCLW